MQSETRKQWWQQLGGMSQGMLFLQGHVVSLETPDATAAPARTAVTRDAAARQRHERAVQRLSERRLRAMTSLSIFR